MDYVLHVLVMVSLYAILASSFNLLIGYAGLFALSHAAFLDRKSTRLNSSHRL